MPARQCTTNLSSLVIANAMPNASIDLTKYTVLPNIESLSTFYLEPKNTTFKVKASLANDSIAALMEIVEVEEPSLSSINKTQNLLDILKKNWMTLPSDGLAYTLPTSHVSGDQYTFIVKVTSEDTTAVEYYPVVVKVGKQSTTNLDSIKISGIAAMPTQSRSDKNAFEKPENTVYAKTILHFHDMKENGIFSIEVNKASDSENATIELADCVEDPLMYIPYKGLTDFTLPRGDTEACICVKVTSEDGENLEYYNVEIVIG